MDDTATKTIPLEQPIPRDGGELAVLRLRRPVSGDLRNLSMARLGQLDFDELRKLLPRISMDGVIAEEVDAMSVADMMEIAGEVTDFLVPRRRMDEFRTS